MSVPIPLAERSHLAWHRRPLPLLVVATACLLAKLSPYQLQRVLFQARRGARKATYEEALAARRAVVAVSMLCAGEGCLQRSIATALLCRTRGAWPTWCAGVRTNPFAAHAWVEVDGQPVDEPAGNASYRPILTVSLES